MKRFFPLLLFVVAVCLIAVQARGAGPPNFGDPVNGLTAAQAANFAAGKTEFVAVESVADGLGPVFNGRSCAECHSVPVIGGGSTLVETRFGRVTNGVFDPLVQFGGSLIQTQGIGPADGSPHQFHGETVPPSANVRAGRRTTPLFGLGLVDATPDSTFIFQAVIEEFVFGVSGRPAYVTNIANNQRSVGKFGWKAQVPSLFVFSGDAYLNEMGITNPLFPNESCPSGNCAELAFNPVPALNDTGTGVAAFNNFMTMLAPPPPGPITIQSLLGEAVFLSIGCEACHTPTFVTGASPVAALNYQVYHPYSDFLVHDMGSLGDGIAQNTVTGREMRTAPLWGLRMITHFLHDGRATTLDAAILAHAGEAKGARDRFAALSATDKSWLRAFLNSL